MRNGRLVTAMVAGLLLVGGTTTSPAGAVAEPTGCCCMGGGPEHCSESTEKACLAKQQAAPQYDDKTKYDQALKKSEAEEAGKMKSGWHEGKCPMAK